MVVKRFYETDTWKNDKVEQMYVEFLDGTIKKIDENYFMSLWNHWIVSHNIVKYKKNGFNYYEYT